MKETVVSKCVEKNLSIIDTNNFQMKAIFYLHWGLVTSPTSVSVGCLKSNRNVSIIPKTKNTKADGSQPQGYDDIPVCKTHFLHTLDISEQVHIVIGTAFDKQTVAEVANPYYRGRVNTTAEGKQTVNNHVEVFPSVKSHHWISVYKFKFRQHVLPQLGKAGKYG